MRMASELINSIKVSDLMSEKVIVVHDSDPISMVITLFERCRISGAPVVAEAHNYVGVISKTDLVGSRLLGLLKATDSLDDIPASQLMSPLPIAIIRRDDPIQLAVEKMLNNGLHRLFVENEDGFLVGVISSFDVMKIVQFINNFEQKNYMMVTPSPSGDATDKNEPVMEEPLIKADHKIAALIMRKQQEMSAKQYS